MKEKTSTAARFFDSSPYLISTIPDYTIPYHTILSALLYLRFVRTSFSLTWIFCLAMGWLSVEGSAEWILKPLDLTWGTRKPSGSVGDAEMRGSGYAATVWDWPRQGFHALGSHGERILITG